jgi:hypothetical protein
MARTIRKRIPDWKKPQIDFHGESRWEDCLVWVNCDLPPNKWGHRRRAKDLAHLRSRAKVKRELQNYLKDPMENLLPLGAKKLTASEFEYSQ